MNPVETAQPPPETQAVSQQGDRPIVTPTPTPKEFNFSAVIVGLPGFGKTSVMASLVRRHLETTSGIVLVHDPVMQFAKHGCYVFEDAAAWRRAAAASVADKQPMARGASIGGLDADDITTLALELGEKLNTADRVTVPILVAYDEGSLRGGSGSTFMSDLDNQALAIRRHRGLGLVFNIQTPTQLTQRFWEMSTDFYIFRQPSDRAKQLEVGLCLEKNTLVHAGITELEKHSYLHVRLGDGLVDEDL